MTLRGRLTLLYAAASALIFAAAMLAVDAAYEHGSDVLADRTLTQALEEAAELVEASGPADLAGLRRRLSAFSDEYQGLFVALRDAQGRTLYESDANLPFVPASGPAAGESIVLRTLPLAKHHRLRLASAWLPLPSSGVWLSVGMALPPAFHLLTSPMGRMAVLALTALIGLLGLTGWILAGRALAPIHSIAQAAETVSRGALEGRIPRGGAGDELGALIDVLNEMLGRIERSSKHLREFAANVSHQLKTPLTVMRGEIDVALRGPGGAGELRAVLKSSLDELEDMSALVEEMLSFARMEQEPAGALVLTRLDHFVEQAARKAGLLARRRAQTVRVAARPVFARVHPLRLEQALLNLIDNAVKNTPEGGVITLEAGPVSRGAELSVRDSGPGVAPEEIPNLFKRGRSRSGTGIGLSLARALVESFSGRIELSSAPSGGLTVHILLPAAPEEYGA